MKKILLISLVLLCTVLIAQEEKLPDAVEENFNENYPTSKLDDWRYENGMYVIDFSVKSDAYTAIYDEDGIWIETAEIISDFDIPEQLQDYLADKYPDGKITDNELVENSDQVNFYRVNIYNDNMLIEVTCNIDGTDIKEFVDEPEE